MHKSGGQIEAELVHGSTVWRAPMTAAGSSVCGFLSKKVEPKGDDHKIYCSG